jgi:hypothetical protein
MSLVGIHFFGPPTRAGQPRHNSFGIPSTTANEFQFRFSFSSRMMVSEPCRISATTINETQPEHSSISITTGNEVQPRTISPNGGEDTDMEDGNDIQGDRTSLTQLPASMSVPGIVPCSVRLRNCALLQYKEHRSPNWQGIGDFHQANLQCWYLRTHLECDGRNQEHGKQILVVLRVAKDGTTPLSNPLQRAMPDPPMDTFRLRFPVAPLPQADNERLSPLAIRNLQIHNFEDAYPDGIGIPKFATDANICRQHPKKLLVLDWNCDRAVFESPPIVEEVWGVRQYPRVVHEGIQKMRQIAIEGGRIRMIYRMPKHKESARSAAFPYLAPCADRERQSRAAEA